MPGMSRDNGTERVIGCGSSPGRPDDRAGGPGERGAAGSASDRGGNGGGDQRSVWLPTKARMTPATMDAAVTATQSLRRRPAVVRQLARLTCGYGSGAG